MSEYPDIDPTDLQRVRAELRLREDTGNISIDTFVKGVLIEMDGYEFERALMGDPDGPVLDDFLDCWRKYYVAEVIDQLESGLNDRGEPIER